jgi:hypothetical protein
VSFQRAMAQRITVALKYDIESVGSDEEVLHFQVVCPGGGRLKKKIQKIKNCNLFFFPLSSLELIKYLFMTVSNNFSADPAVGRR